MEHVPWKKEVSRLLQQNGSPVFEALLQNKKVLS